MAAKITLALSVALMAVAYSSAGDVLGTSLGLPSYPRYQYQYGVSDGITGDNKQASEVRDGHYTATQYSQNLVHARAPVALGAVAAVPAYSGLGLGVRGLGLGLGGLGARGLAIGGYAGYPAYSGLGLGGLRGIGGLGLGGIGAYGGLGLGARGLALGGYGGYGGYAGLGGLGGRAFFG